MRVAFALRDLPGSVEVIVEPNEDPWALGCPSFAKDFPVCIATVTYSGSGYNAALGWIQLVRSTDGSSAGKHFEMDPFEPLGRLPHPFCWFGFAPTLFDAPSRASRDPVEWTAHSFLCFMTPVAGEWEIRAILGFSWGFSIRDELISLSPPTMLASAEWDAHLELLGREHPAWDFATGYRDR